MIRATSWYTPVPKASDTLVRGLRDRPGPLLVDGQHGKVRAAAHVVILAPGTLVSAAAPVIADVAAR